MSKPYEAMPVLESLAQLEPGVAESLVANRELEIEQLATHSQFKDGVAVRSFLSRHVPLLLLLREAHHKIKTVFGFETGLALEVFTDPDDDDGQQLFVLIRTALPVDEALAQLERLDEAWWLDAAPRAEGWLNLDVEYV
jgi:hypothetical protein